MIFKLFVVFFPAGVFGNIDIFPALPVGVPNVNNAVCREDSDLYVEQLRNMSLWAYEMRDATAKSTTGVLRGSVFQMGHFEQCLTAKSPFPPQYCLATLQATVPKPDVEHDPLSLYHPPNNSVLQRLYKYEDKTQQSRNVIKVGWCIPASCTPMDLEESLNKYLSSVHIPLVDKNVTYSAKVYPINCQTVIEKPLDALDISFCFLVMLLVVLTVASTTYDYILKKKENGEKPVEKNSVQKLALSFSAKQNISDLTRADDSNTAMKILYGMRTLSIIMIIMDHRFGTFTSSALLNFDFVERQYRSFFACLIFHGDLFVDSFFVLSGLLVTYGLMKHQEKKPITPITFIFLRYIRLTPVYAFVIFYYATMFNHTGSGPLWPVIAGQDTADCRANWWTNLLYVSNYVNPDHMCMTHSWYLPCDFHYFIIALGVCYLLKKEKKFGFGALLLICLVSVVIPFIITVVYRRPALMHFYPDFLTGPKSHPDFLLTYSKSHTRATPYFLGMFAGYIYHKLRGSEFHICKMKSHLLTLGSLLFILAAIFGGSVFYDPYHPYNPIESGIYAALHRPAWALGSIGLLVVTSYGHNPFLYRIFTWSPLIPLSKLVYGAYLIHIQFQLRSAAKFEGARLISYFDLISLALGDIVLAFFSAFLMYIGIEAPCRNIFKELLMPPKKREAKSESTEVIANSRESVASSAVSNGTSVSRL